MKKVILIIGAVLLSAAGSKAQTQSGQTDYLSVIYGMCDSAGAARFEFDYSEAEDIIRRAIMVFESQSNEFQEKNTELKGELYYDLTRYLALQDKAEEALDTFALAIDHGWSNHSFAKNDGDLDSIRRERRFRQMLLAIKK